MSTNPTSAHTLDVTKYVPGAVIALPAGSLLTLKGTSTAEYTDPPKVVNSTTIGWTWGHGGMGGPAIPHIIVPVDIEGFETVELEFSLTYVVGS